MRLRPLVAKLTITRLKADDFEAPLVLDSGVIACMASSRLEARRVVFSRVALGVRFLVALLSTAARAPRCLRGAAEALLRVDAVPLGAERFLAARFFVEVLTRVAMPDP